MTEIVAAYIRASTETQEDSPETQRAIIDEFCLSKDYVIPPDLLFVDFGISGGVPMGERPSGKRLLRLVADRRRVFSKIVIVRTDRAWRLTEDQLATFALAKRHGVQFVAARQEIRTETAHDIFMMTVVAGVTTLERQLTGERIREHNLVRHRKGLHMSGYPPLGLILSKDPDGPMSVDTAALVRVVAVYEAYAGSGGNLTRAAYLLNTNAIASPRGGLWSVRAILLCLTSPLYRRAQFYAGELIDKPGIIPETLPAALIARVDALLVSRYGHWCRGAAPPTSRVYARTAYSGLLSCPACGRGMTLIPHGIERAAGPTYAFRCYGVRAQPPTCAYPSLHAPTVDCLVGEAVRAGLLGAGIGAERRKAAPQPRATPNIDDRRRRATDAYIDGAISADEYRRQIERIDKDAARPMPEVAAPALSSETVADLLARWHTVWTPGIRNMAKRELLHGALQVPRGGIVATKEGAAGTMRARWTVRIQSEVVAGCHAEYDGLPIQVKGKPSGNF